MSRPLRGWIDYDRPHLQGLAPDERISYFDQRVRLVAINPLDRILRNEIHVSPQSSALLIYGVSICCMIEATGKFLTGGTTGNADRFYAFLHTYMSPDFKSKSVGGTSYGEVLWLHFRNGLAHGFAVCHGGFEGNRGEPYFKVEQIMGRDSLKVNPSILYDDYVTGFDNYLGDLGGAQPGGDLYRKFDHVFESVFIRGE